MKTKRKASTLSQHQERLDDEHIVRILAEREKRKFRDFAQHICRNNDIEFTDDGGVSESMMWAQIGLILAREHPNFERKNRGQPSKPEHRTKGYQLALIVDEIKAACIQEGEKYTDSQILRRMQELGFQTQAELDSLRSSVSRGRRPRKIAK